MAKMTLRQHYRGADGRLYYPGKDVEVPAEAKLKPTRGQPAKQEAAKDDKDGGKAGKDK